MSQSSFENGIEHIFFFFFVLRKNCAVDVTYRRTKLNSSFHRFRTTMCCIWERHIVVATTSRETERILLNSRRTPASLIYFFGFLSVSSTYFLTISESALFHHLCWGYLSWIARHIFRARWKNQHNVGFVTECRQRTLHELSLLLPYKISSSFFCSFSTLRLMLRSVLIHSSPRFE